MSLDEKAPALAPEDNTGLTEGNDTTASPQADKAEKPAESLEGTPPTEDHEIFLEGEDEESPSVAPKDSAAWARLRKAESAGKARNAELERKLADLQRPAGAADPGPEPTIEGCDYDEVLLKKRVREWDRAVDQKRAAEAQMAEQAEVQRRANQSRMDAYGTAKADLSKRVSGYPEAEAAVIAALSLDRQDALLKTAENAAKIVYTLGQRPELLEELAKETDRDRFVAKLVKLEAKIVERKKGTQAPPPEKSPRGTGTGGTADSTLDTLRAKADKTGDRTAVTDYLRKKREAARGR